MDKKDQHPIYQNFITTLEAGFGALDSDSRNQISSFIESRQHEDGGFMDRSGRSDPYYSLFGCLLSAALDLNALNEKHRSFVKECILHKPDKTIDLLALTLIRTVLFKTEKGPSIVPILKKIIKERHQIDLTYRFFLLLLVLDAQNKYTSTLNFIARIWLRFYHPTEGIPCSISAALLFVKRRVGLNYQREQQKLLTFYVEGRGFKVLNSVENCDMLSTAVALFVLKDCGYDLRLISPSCLDFIEENFDSGAFLSGDGDQTRDLEYTFYGLIALGSLISEDED